jgi:hypothetical protein
VYKKRIEGIENGSGRTIIAVGGDVQVPESVEALPDTIYKVSPTIGRSCKQVTAELVLGGKDKIFWYLLSKPPSKNRAEKPQQDC